MWWGSCLELLTTENALIDIEYQCQYLPFRKCCVKYLTKIQRWMWLGHKCAGVQKTHIKNLVLEKHNEVFVWKHIESCVWKNTMNLCLKNTENHVIEKHKVSCAWKSPAFMLLLWTMLMRHAFTETVWNISNLCFSTPLCIHWWFRFYPNSLIGKQITWGKIWCGHFYSGLF